MDVGSNPAVRTVEKLKKALSNFIKKCTTDLHISIY